MDISRTFEKMAESGVFVVLGTASYLQEIRKHGDCYHQVMMAKALRKPAILILDQRLLPSECEELRQGLNGLEVIGTVLVDSEHLEDRALNELKEIMETWKKRSSV
ncbi:hypothetical protein ES703_70023 [subsurface metagenome]